jgi:hypothetical protein
MYINYTASLSFSPKMIKVGRKDKEVFFFL